MAHDAGPTARALLALEAIQNRPGLTGQELADRLGVTDRAARRYVGILREAGVPIDSVSGRHGGYRLGRGARIPPLMFSTTEALGLVVALLRGWHGATDSDDPAATALGKILRVLPDSVAAPVDALRRVVAQNPNDAAATPDPALAAAIAHAAETRARLRIGYSSLPDHVRSMELDPWAVVVRHGRWYLLCWSHSAAARRVLRIDRITTTEIVGDGIAPPAALDAVQEVEDHLAEGWTHRVEVRFDAPIDRVGPCLPRALGRLTATGDETCVLRGSTDDPAWYAGLLAAVPVPFALVGSDAVRAEVAAIAARLDAAIATSRASSRATHGPTDH